MDTDDSFMDLVRRSRKGYSAFAASMDLQAFSAMTVKNPREARQRLDDLQMGVGGNLIFYPGGNDYRVCFAGDSVFLIRELEPETDLTEPWASFCGHIYAIACMEQDTEIQIGNPGLRVVIASGPLLQIKQPDIWKEMPGTKEQTRNWFVLTGASQGFRKCIEAEGGGRTAGFLPGYCWHERLESPNVFRGTPLYRLSRETYGRPELYPEIYGLMIENADREATLVPVDNS